MSSQSPTRNSQENLDLLDLDRIRSYFPAIRHGRIATNNASSTQIPDQLLNLYRELAITYENVHRGQSSAAIETTRLFEHAYEAIADFIGACYWSEIILYRGATEAINAVMYSLMTEFRDGDNVVTTYMEHNSNYVPWYGLSREILPKFGINVECRLAKFDRETGELDIDHLASLVDKRTKIICCTGASNFLGTKPPIDKVREIADKSGYEQPSGIKRSYFLVDGAQLVPNTFTDVSGSGLDFLAWSFHKMLAPVGVGGLYVRKDIGETLRPFQYGGDMIAEGKVSPEHVSYNITPWRFTAGTPNIIGTIIAGRATRLLPGLALGMSGLDQLDGRFPMRNSIQKAMSLIEEHEKELSAYLIEALSAIDGLTIYGPKDPERRVSLVSFNIAGQNPLKIAEQLDRRGIESRAGCHCATLAHYFYGLDPPASCRISPYLYNTMEEMQAVVSTLKDIIRQP